jgi:hypothetical protein
MLDLVTNIAFIGVCLSAHARNVIDERAAVDQLLARFPAAEIKWEHQVQHDWDPTPFVPRVPRGAAGLRWLLGDDMFERVEDINLQAQGCKDADLNMLPKCRRLTMLSLSDNEKLSDKGVRNLAANRYLEYLTLDGTQVTDDTLKQLQSLPLGYISLDRTKITRGAVAEFQRTHRDSAIEYEGWPLPKGVVKEEVTNR